MMVDGWPTPRRAMVCRRLRVAEAEPSVAHPSAIMYVEAFVLPEVIRGIIDASATRNPPPGPRTAGSPTRSSGGPMRQVPAGSKVLGGCAQTLDSLLTAAHA